MNRVLEQGLRDMPEQYMWIPFKIFKTRPDGALLALADTSLQRSSTHATG